MFRRWMRVIPQSAVSLCLLIILSVAETSFYYIVGQRTGPLRPFLEMPLFDSTHLGEGEVGDILTGDLPLRNRGSIPLHFEVASGCACTELSPKRGNIEPGGIQKVHVGIRLRYRGKQEVAAILIQSNDPEKPLATHTFIAKNVMPFAVSPEAIDFGRVMDDGNARTASLCVLGPGSKPLAPHFEVSATCDNPYITVLPDKSQPGQRSFRLILQRGAPRGPVTGLVKLCVSHDPTPFEVPVRGDVEGLLRVAPETVYLPGPGVTGRECTVVAWRADGKPLGKLVESRVPKGSFVERCSDEAATRVKLKIVIAETRELTDLTQMGLRFENAPGELVIQLRSWESGH